jgi:hypothetical protein
MSSVVLWLSCMPSSLVGWTRQAEQNQVLLVQFAKEAVCFGWFLSRARLHWDFDLMAGPNRDKLTLPHISPRAGKADSNGLCKRPYANAFCIIEMHNAAKNVLQRALQTSMHFLWDEGQRYRSPSLMHLYCSSIFQHIYITFSNPCNSLFNVFTPTSALSYALCLMGFAHAHMHYVHYPRWV